jgi:predicted aspartyl protease
MKPFIVQLLLSIVTLTAFGQTSTQSIPFKLVHDLIVFELKVNNSENLSFIFDTGAGVTVIDSTTASKLKLAISDSTQIGTAGKTFLTPVSSNNNIQIESINVTNAQLYVMQLSHFSKLFKYKIDGVIGYDILKKYIIETNIIKKEMRFSDSCNFMYSGSGTSIKFSKLDNNHIIIGVHIRISHDKEIEVPFILDTGSNEYIALFDNAIKKYDLLDSNKKYKTKSGFSVDNAVTKNYQVKLKSFSIGNLRWEKVPSIYIVNKQNIVSGNKYKSSVYGRIGQKILNDCIITYDYKSNLIYIEKVK